MATVNSKKKELLSSVIKNLNSIIDKDHIFNYFNGHNGDYPTPLSIIKNIKPMLLQMIKKNPENDPFSFSKTEITRYTANIERLFELTVLIVSNAHSSDDILSLKQIYYKLLPIHRTILLLENTNENKNSIDNIKLEINDKLSEIDKIHTDSINTLNNLSKLAKENNSTNREIKNISNEIKSELITSQENSQLISNLLSKSENTYSNIENIKNTLDSASIALKAFQDKNEITNKIFDAYIDESKNKVDNLLEKEVRVSNLEKKISDSINSSDRLISQATTAMTLTGTFRLSRSFKASYLLAKSSRERWAVASIVASVICLCFIGFMLYEMYNLNYTIFEKTSTPAIIIFVARFSMIPVILGFFIFCAMQYIKQNNICEDYAHKKLLSETLISFKDELAHPNNEMTSEFLTKILDVVLRSPLTSFDKKVHKAEIKQLNELANQAREISNTVADKISPENKK